jgi:predicted RNA-binding protein YlxR (DUF448 family)
VTRETGARNGLIRFAISPDGEVVPDLVERLPGRGLWLTARGDIVRKACAENSFSRAARQRVKVPADLPERLAGLLDQRCRDLIGLARRSGEAVAGFEKVRAAAKDGGVAVLLEASDGASDGREKILRAAPGARVLSLWTAAELGAPFGRDEVVHAAILKGGLADRLLRDALRLEGLRNEDADGGVPKLQES